MILKALNRSHEIRREMVQRRSISSCKNKDKEDKELDKKENKKTMKPIPSFMPVINIPVNELAHNAFYSLHRPLLGLSIPQPFLLGDIVGQITKEDELNNSEEELLKYMNTLKPFEPPKLEKQNNIKETTTTLTIDIDPSYFLNHNNNHDEIADYLTSMSEKLDLLFDERSKNLSNQPQRKKFKRFRKRKSFF